jgi:3-methyladenine DNA glycosylase AlkD
MEYLEPLINSFRSAKNPAKSVQMQNYMRGIFPFLGLDKKSRDILEKEFFKNAGYPQRKDLFNVVFELWDLPEREFQMCAISLLRKFQNSLKKNDISSIEKLIVTKSWWDSVDGLSGWICGTYFNLYPEKTHEITLKWVESGNFWLQRSALLFQLKYKKDTDTELLKKYISRLAGEKEFFIRKAIGWILREYSKTNPDWVKFFISTIQLSPLSLREAKKYI